MNYGDALAWLYGSQTFGIKLGLDNTHRLLAALGHPQRKLRFLHVAGTNGKGSTCAMLDAMLRAGGLHTGLYTSPHLVDFRERIRVDGHLIPEDATAEGLTLLREASVGWEHAPTFFELATVLAAWWFAREGAEIVVWETGMGGRLDATNAVSPLVSVITPIGMDHQQWLGHTLAEIAAEKAGIIKPGVPVVSAPQAAEARNVLAARANEIGAPILFVEQPWNEGAVALPGEHQRWNAASARAALDAAGLVPCEDARRRGLAAVQWDGRFQIHADKFVLDGAHNPEAARVLLRTWREIFGAKKARLVFHAMRDKDAEVLLRILREIADEIWLVPVSGNPRSCPEDELRAMADAAGFATIHATSLTDALRRLSSLDGPVLITGSLFLVGEALARLRGQSRPRVSVQ